MMKTTLTRKLLLVAALVSAGLASGATPATSQSRCDGRVSWLTGYCTYCEWGGACGACKIGGCTELKPNVPG